MAAKKKAEVIELERRPLGLLDQIIESQRIPLDRLEIPEGHTLLPGGVLRLIRVNRQWIAYGQGKPYIVVEDGREQQYAKVVFLGAVELTMTCGVKHVPDGCGSREERTAAVQSRGPLAVA